jgi:hypothetical protein
MTDLLAQPVQTKPTFYALRTMVNRSLKELEELGSPDAIAAFFTEQGLPGQPTVMKECPVAKFLQQRTNWSDVGVDTGCVVVNKGPFCRVYRTPEVVTAFVKKFDHGAYPFLDEDNALPPDDGPTPLPDAALVSLR